jgi:pyrroline-5-carboxylate reductase
MSVPVWPARLLILGCGNMGGAMLAGWLRGGIEPSRFTVVDPVLAEAPDGVTLLRELPGAGEAFDAILLGVKPQMLDAVAPRLAPLVGPGTVLLSILAGVELASLSARFPQAGTVVRIMPNLAAAIGKSPMGLVGQNSGGDGLDPALQAGVTALLAPLGTPEWLADEGLLHAVTALAGSGPAFVYRFIDALAEGGAGLGLPPEQALRLALAMVEGAAALAAASDASPGELARRVASPGGTTEAGLKVLDEGQAITRLVAATLAAARDRSVEMAAAARASQG